MYHVEYENMVSNKKKREPVQEGAIMAIAGVGIAAGLLSAFGELIKRAYDSHHGVGKINTYQDPSAIISQLDSLKSIVIDGAALLITKEIATHITKTVPALVKQYNACMHQYGSKLLDCIKKSAKNPNNEEYYEELFNKISSQLEAKVAPISNKLRLHFDKYDTASYKTYNKATDEQKNEIVKNLKDIVSFISKKQSLFGYDTQTKKLLQEMANYAEETFQSGWEWIAEKGKLDDNNHFISYNQVFTEEDLRYHIHKLFSHMK